MEEAEEGIQTEQDLLDLIARVRKAQEIFSTYSQEQVDKIFYAAAKAANRERIPLAQLAVQETGMGVMEDKVIKNHFASEYIYNKYKDVQTVGVIHKDESNGYEEILEPLGVVAAIVPTTNPTSTAIFKALICLKTRNGVIFSPHPRARIPLSARPRLSMRRLLRLALRRVSSLGLIILLFRSRSC